MAKGRLRARLDPFGSDAVFASKELVQEVATGQANHVAPLEPDGRNNNRKERRPRTVPIPRGCDAAGDGCGERNGNQHQEIIVKAEKNARQRGNDQ